jgi:hypothetical protein
MGFRRGLRGKGLLARPIDGSLFLEAVGKQLAEMSRRIHSSTGGVNGCRYETSMPICICS